MLMHPDYAKSPKKILIQIFSYTIIVVLMTLLMAMVLASARIDPFDIDKFENAFFLTFTNTVVPPMTIFIFCVGYYVGDNRLPKKLAKNIIVYALIKVME